MKNLVILRNGPGEPIAFLTQDTDDYRGTMDPSFTVTRRIEKAHGFDHYSDAMNAILNSDTRGWKYSEIAPAMTTRFVDPPIPTGFEWFAFYEGDEPNEEGCQPTGYGSSEQAAIENLLVTHPRGRV